MDINEYLKSGSATHMGSFGVPVNVVLENKSETESRYE